MNNTAKRKVVDDLQASPPVKKAVHSFFTGGVKPLGNFLLSPPSLIHYLHLEPFVTAIPPAPAPTTSSSTSSATSLAAVSTTATAGPSKISIIFYDLDGTLIKPKGKSRFPTSREDWTWWHPSVPEQMKREVAEGKHLIVISNQGDSRPKIRSEWKAKLPLIAAHVPTVPLRVLAALDKYDVYRKPNIGMFQVVERIYRDKGLEIDLDKSVFVGDAAGRLAFKGKEKDHGDTDYKFALNVGLRFVTPEEHFLRDPRPSFPEPPLGFRPTSIANLATLPPIVPSNTPIARKETEIVLFVGPPASGKTSFFRTHFAPNGYEHINQDLLGTRDRCLARAEAYLKMGKLVVIDNTNRNKATRAYYVELAERMGVPIRLFHFLCPIELAKHNNMYRAVYAPKEDPARTLLPGSAFFTYKNDFQAPHVDEGFDEIKSVNFVWKGTEKQRQLWDMYMLETR